jgi:hypothetical protein
MHGVVHLALYVSVTALLLISWEPESRGNKLVTILFTRDLDGTAFSSGKLCPESSCSLFSPNPTPVVLAHPDPGVRASYGRYVCQSGFATLSPVSLYEQSVVVLLLEWTLISCSLAMDEPSGHEDLRGSNRQSVIPYEHGRIELYCSSLYAWACLFIRRWEVTPVRAFYSKVGQLKWVSRPDRLPRVGWPYTAVSVLMARSSKWCLVRRQQRGVVLSYPCNTPCL